MQKESPGEACTGTGNNYQMPSKPQGIGPHLAESPAVKLEDYVKESNDEPEGQ
jgi:hypothetical protein